MTRIKFLLLVFVVMQLAMHCAIAQGKRPASKQPEFISTSDIHFNPFYDGNLVLSLMVTDYTKWDSIFKLSSDKDISEDGADANYALFVSALEGMRKTNPKPQYIIVTGDFLAHNFIRKLNNQVPDENLRTAFVNNTIRFTAYMFNKYFPATVILPVLGNNDSYCGDYDMAPQNPFLNMFAKAWVPLQRNNSKVKDSIFVAQFSKGGYYAFSPKGDPNHKLLLLNTIFFSRKYVNTCTGGDTSTTQGGIDEMMWLQNELQANAAMGAKANKLWLEYHIPPGIDVFGSTRPGIISAMWDSSYNRRFLGFLNTYSNNITANFAGHTHMDDFRVLYNAEKKPVSFVHITPSISRSNGNYPGFQVFSYSTGAYALTNYKTYYLNAKTDSPGTAWALEYDFNQQYGLAGVNAGSLATLRTKLATDATLQNAFMRCYEVSNMLHVNSVRRNWQCYWCGSGELNAADYVNCVNKQ